MSGRRRWIAASTVSVLALGAVVWQLTTTPVTTPQPSAPGRVAAIVVDESGSPVAGAQITAGEQTATSGPDGRVALTIDAAVIATIDAPGHVHRAQALDPAAVARIVLPTRAADSLAIRFGGDVMMGRRFFEPGADGSPAPLTPQSTAAVHAALLDGIRPLIDDADLTVVNLETSLVADPYIPPGQPRPARFHPTKDLVFASSLQTAAALKLAGIDAVSLGNNHVYDALEAGLDSTISALDAAGVTHFGAGRTEAEAWAPAIITRQGQRIAFVGCTTVDGRDEPISYVAGPGKGGAADCATARLTRAVSDAKAQADLVVVMLHGAVEYRRDQTDKVRGLTHAAAQAGAALVITSHPHVIGGITRDGNALVAESTGNLVFDQDLWATVPSYLLRADLAGRRALALTADPLVIDGYRPRPAVGALASAPARLAAGTVPGATRLDGPGAVVESEHSDGTQPPVGIPGRAALLPAGQVRTLGAGWWVAATDPATRVGTDLLFGSGELEPSRLIGSTAASPPLWELGRNVTLTPAASCSTTGGTASGAGAGGGGMGLSLVRSPVSQEDVFATPSHRALVTPGTELTLLADVRSASDQGQLELRWYAAADGPSTDVLVLPIPAQPDESACHTIRLDVSVPAGMSGVQPYVRLRPTNDTQLGAHLLVDNIRLVAWAPPGSSGRVFDTVAALGPADAPARVTLAYDPSSLPDVTPPAWTGEVRWAP